MGQLAGFRFNRLEVFTLAADLELGGSLPRLSLTNSSSRLRFPISFISFQASLFTFSGQRFIVRGMYLFPDE